MESQDEKLLLLTYKITKAYVETNRIEPDKVSLLINSINNSIWQLSNKKLDKKLVPFIDPKKSVHDNYIICLEDGRKMPMIRRYIREEYGFTPEQYRERWGLPANYPMVAPSYAAKRSRIAKEMGLGKRKK